MSLRLQSLFMTALFAALAALAVGGSLVSLIPNLFLVGAALAAGYLAILSVTLVQAIRAGRKAAEPYTDPRYGALAGTATGAWVGLGAALGQVGYALLAQTLWHAEFKAGLIAGFCVMYLGTAIIAARIAGRQAAHPPEAEEEA